jgi:hypothetical protein
MNDCALLAGELAVVQEEPPHISLSPQLVQGVKIGDLARPQAQAVSV